MDGLEREPSQASVFPWSQAQINVGYVRRGIRQKSLPNQTHGSSMIGRGPG